MKKSLLVLAILGTLTNTALAQSNVTIWGIVDTGVQYVSKAGTTGDSKLALNSGIINSSRFGFRGSEDLGGGLKALFMLEAGFSNDTGALSSDVGTTSLFRREALVGLSGGFGTVLAGRQTDYAKILGINSSVADFGSYVTNVGHGLGRLVGIPNNNTISYTINGSNGVNGNLLYGFGETSGSSTAGRVIGTAASWQNGPLFLGAAYYASNQGKTPSDTSLINSTTTNVTNDGAAVRVFNLVGSYQFEKGKLYANWSHVKQPGASSTLGAATVYSTTANIIGGYNNDKADIYEIGANYFASPALKFITSVQHSRLTFLGSSASTKGQLTQVNLGADYFLSQRTDLYFIVSELFAKNTLNPGTGVGTANALGNTGNQLALNVGMRHRF